ncbi:MAG: aldehyde dehydrogenase family protein [Acidimicrobiia bacterium]|nr:aldehyde dehydrogenase family protein [Acidimicrobiia bacterium]
MLVIAGQAVRGDEGDYEIRNPVRPGEVVHRAPASSCRQLDAAVEAARAAATEWSRTPLAERIQLVVQASAAAEQVVEEQDLAPLLTREQGKVLQEAVFDVGLPAHLADVYRDLAPEALAPRRLVDDLGETEIEPVPWGVVGAILPFNWPVSLMATKVVPALIAGNTAVAKPPPTCPAAMLAVAAAMAAALPAGVLNTVSGPGPELGRSMVGHPGIDLVSFTGGVPTGRAVLAAASARMAPAVLELGGNDPAILAPDVGVDEDLAGALVAAAFLTAGQVCMAVKRLYVPRDRVEEVTDALVAECERAVIGDGLAGEVTMGPLHTAAGRDRVEELVAEAEAEGATAYRCGGVRPEDAGAAGHLSRPTIVVGAPPGSRLVREEQFGPALPVMGYDDFDDVVTQANDTTFGLCASVWSGDPGLASDLARRLEAGTVFVNAHGMFAVDARAPFGGWKESGLGRELGPDGLLAFTRSRTLANRAL